MDYGNFFTGLIFLAGLEFLPEESEFPAINIQCVWLNVLWYSGEEVPFLFVRSNGMKKFQVSHTEISVVASQDLKIFEIQGTISLFLVIL